MRYQFYGILFLIIAILAGCTKFEEKIIPVSNISDVNKTSCKIIALGDSLTAGYDLSPEKGYPAQLEKILQENGYNCKVINAGISGDTTKNLLDRLEFSLGSDSFTLALVVIGGNDGLRNIAIPEMKKNIVDILQVLKSRNIPVVLGGMQMPANAGLQVAEFKKTYSDLAEEYSLSFIPFFLEGVAMNPKLNLPDGIHPNSQGYKIIAGNVFKFLEDNKLLVDFKEIN